jgi:hypothetical protein
MKESVKIVNENDVHRLWDLFESRFKVGDGVEPEDWKCVGFPLMQQVEQWARRHSEVQIIRCDDALYSSSFIVLIPHQSRDMHHGVSMVSIPQNGPNGLPPAPTVMFLYPRAQKELIAGLVSIQTDFLNGKY